MRGHGNLIAAIGVALFSVGACVSAAQEITLYSFKGSNFSDGSGPECNLIFDSAGNLYGTTSSGGAVGAPYDTYGTAFELVAGAGGTWTEKVLYSFGSAAGDGTGSLSGLVFDVSGNLYGTTNLGGAYKNGTVYELSPGQGGTWTEKVIYSFGVTSADGAEPRRGSLIFDSKGNLYGTTLLGGGNTVSNGDGVETAGTVFELSPGTGGNWTEKVLYSFGATSTDAANPVDGLVFDALGNLYGTTKYGGTSNSGTAFELSPGSNGTWTENVIHSFADNGADGSIPESGLTFDKQGNLYGTTYGGGINPASGGLGAVFELSPAGGGDWSEQVIYSFNSAVGVGDYPLGGVIFDAAGNLYGTASSGLFAYGQVYELSPTASGWKETTLYKFGATPDGSAPYNGLVFDTQGNLYGTDSTGGAIAADFGLGGTVYEIPNVTTASPTFSPGTGAYTATQMVKVSDATPDASIYYSINGGPGTLYSTEIEVSESESIQAYATTTTLPRSQVATASYQIGTTAAAPVFSVPAGTYTTAQSLAFTDVAPDATIYYTTNGSTPTTSSTKYTGPITVSSTETVKAFAVAAGYANSPVVSAAYTILTLTLPTENVIYDFLPPADQGASQPQSSLIADSAGNLYGTTQGGGGSGFGSVFELIPPTGTGQWTQKILYSFAGTPDGQAPLAGLVFDSKGNLYGTTTAGGTWDSGTVFKLTPTTSGPWTETILHHFDYLTNDGTTPMAGLSFDASGNLYGTTSGGGAYSSGNANPGGTVFELTPGTGGTWTENILHSFDYLNQSDGYYPLAGVVFDSLGNLYGTTSDGGAGQDSEGGGTVFELSPAVSGTWTEKVLHNFGGCAEFCTDGFLPKSTPVIDGAGNVYGTTSTGGPNDFGTGGMVFELSPGTGGTWTETVVHNFGAYETDGGRPLSGLALDVDGNLYGTTYTGGLYGSGTVFELSPAKSGPWTESVLHNFSNNGTDGANPYAALLVTTSGKVYGTAFAGGTSGDGIAFEFAVSLNGTPAVALSASSLSYGSVAVGAASGSQLVTLTNSGNAKLSIASIAVTGANASSFVFGNNCGASVAVRASCTIHGHFAPTADGALTAAITITDNSANSPQTISLSGTGTGAAPPITLSATSLAFPSTTEGATSSSQSVTMTNVGSAALPITSIAVTGTNASSWVFANSCGTSLAAGANCTIHGHFAPTSAGALKAAVTITYSGTGSPQSIALSGTGLATPVTLSATSLSFGSVDLDTSSGSQSVTMTNSGTAALSISSIAVTGTNASSFVFANSCGTSLTVGANCTIHGHFAPTAAGALKAAITITDSATTSPQSIALSGTGVAPTAPVTLSATSLSFGAVKVGSASASQSVTMTNTGTAALLISSIALTGADASSFVFANTCGTSLAIAASCTIHGHFAPAAAGTRTAAITITDSATGSPQTIALSGTGQ